MDFRNLSEVYYAEQLLQEGKRREAFNVLSEYVKRDPSSPQAWYLLSTLITGEDKQVYCLERALKLDPGHEMARAHLAKLKNIPGSKKKSKGNQSVLLAIGLVVAFLVLAVIGGGYILLSQPQAASSLPEQINHIIYSPTFTLTATSTNTFTPPPTLTLTPSVTALPSFTPFPTETAITPLALIYSSPTSVPISDAEIGVEIGKYAPDFSGRLVGKDKTRINLYDFAGNPIVLVFWSLDTPVNVKYLSTVEALYEQYRNQGLVVLAVGVKVDLPTATETQQERNLTFKMLIDPQDKIHRSYGNYELPLTIFIAKSKKVADLQVGNLGIQTMQTIVEPLLKEVSTATPEPSATSSP